MGARAWASSSATLVEVISALTVVFDSVRTTTVSHTMLSRFKGFYVGVQASGINESHYSERAGHHIIYTYYHYPRTLYQYIIYRTYYVELLMYHMYLSFCHMYLSVILDTCYKMPSVSYAQQGNLPFLVPSTRSQPRRAQYMMSGVRSFPDIPTFFEIFMSPDFPRQIFVWWSGYFFKLFDSPFSSRNNSTSPPDKLLTPLSISPLFSISFVLVSFHVLLFHIHI